MALQTLAGLDVTYHHPTVDPLLTEELVPLVEGAIAAIVRVSERHGFRRCLVRVSGFVSYEDDSTAIVLTQKVDLPPQSALDYGEELAIAVWDWSATLPDTLRDLARARIVTSVDWHVDKRAA